MFNEPTNHFLIPRKNNVMIEKKQVTIHTEDRDTRLNNDGNTIETQSKFSIQMPESLENIAYVQLKNIQIPTYYINISERYKNNKINVEIPNDPTNPNDDDDYTIIIPDGFYTPSMLLQQLYFLTFKDYGSGTKTSFIDPASSSLNRLIFSNNNGDLSNLEVVLRFDNLSYSEENTCFYKNSYLLNDYSNVSKKWGLGYILGFDYCSTFKIGYNAGSINTTSIDTLPTPTILTTPQNDIRLDYIKTIYLEVNDFNTISEKKPDTGNRNDVFNSGYHGMGDAALAKIPIPGISDGFLPTYNILSSGIPGEFLETKKIFLNSFKTRVSRLNFTFRDHNGSLIDFNDQDFTFTLEFGIVREVPNRILNILNFT